MWLLGVVLGKAMLIAASTLANTIGLCGRWRPLSEQVPSPLGTWLGGRICRVDPGSFTPSPSQNRT